MNVELDVRISHVIILLHPAITVPRSLPAARNLGRAAAHLSCMTDTSRVRQHHRGLRSAALVCAAAMSVAGLLLAGCGSSGASSASAAGSNSTGAHSAAAGLPAAASEPDPIKAASGAQAPATQTIGLLSARSIIYTASLTVQTGDVQAAVQHAAAIVTAAGGYLAAEQESSQPGQRQVSSASLQLKVPVSGYQAALGSLRTELGSQTALSQRAQDVTQQVADVTSRVASAQAAIAQLRALLRRAGSVSGLLDVQEQINSQESDLEALQAQQRALAHATTFATVSLLLVSHHAEPVKKKKEHGFVAGLAAGWRGLRRATAWLLTAVGTVLPFALIVALAGGIGYAGRRRVLRRRVPPTAAD